MSDYQRQFKGDIFNGIIELIKNIWKPIVAGYLLYFGLGKLFTFFIFRSLGYSNMEDFTASYMENILDQDVMVEQFEEILALLMQPQVIAGIIVGLIAFFLVMNWMYYFGYKVANNEIKGENKMIGEVLKSSLDMRLAGFVLFFIIFMIIYILLFGGAIAVVMISPFLLLISIPVAIYVLMKLSLAYTAYGMNDQLSYSESLEFSWTHLTGIRILKIIGIGLVTMFGLGIISALVGQIGQIAANIPVLGIAIRTVLEFISGSISIIFITAAFAALYYRYAEDIVTEDLSIEDHLIENSL